MDSTLQIRIDKKTKKEAGRIFKNMGIDMSSGIKLFLQSVINTESIPFTIITKNGFTESQEQTMIKETKESLKKGEGYSSACDLHKNILKK